MCHAHCVWPWAISRDWTETPASALEAAVKERRNVMGNSCMRGLWEWTEGSAGRKPPTMGTGLAKNALKPGVVVQAGQNSSIGEAEAGGLQDQGQSRITETLPQ